MNSIGWAFIYTVVFLVTTFVVFEALDLTFGWGSIAVAVFFAAFGGHFSGRNRGRA